MERLGGHVRSELERYAPGEADLVALVRAWPAAVGEQVARNAWPARLGRDRTLLVHAVSATWAFELGRMAQEILERLRAEAGDAAPVGLRFVPGPVPEPAAEPGRARQPEVLPAAAEHSAEAARIAASVEDEELRALVARAAAASLARARPEPGSGRRF